ncbi:NAD(+) kinase [[Mycoplasma] testudinis]|uniref:NAD(+) kinase n=1 Tax=[Mycoplasma] testudinis TaxID=33924 RepID=UPI0004856265|nr:NAD(+) kinase [[Mycoplasma] testudinis]
MSSTTKTTFKIVASPSPKAQSVKKRVKMHFLDWLEVETNNPDYLFIIGGDGTFIREALNHNKPGVKIVGINGGTVGFYAAFSDQQVDVLCKNLRDESFRQIHLLDLDVGGIKTVAVNELSIVSSTAYPLDIYFNDIFYEKFRGTGVLVGTRAGSTGFVKSARGAVVFPGVDCIEFVELDPLLHVGFITIQAPIILPSDTIITIKPAREYTQESNCPRVYADGNEINKNFCVGKIVVKPVKSAAKFLLPNNHAEFIKKLQSTFIKG